MRVPVFASLLLSLALFTGAPPGMAQDSDPIRSVISAQLEAFRAGDVVAAYDYASPMIRAIFPTPQVFGEMVGRGYPEISNPGAVEFLGQREEAGQPVQRVLLRGQGNLRVFDYTMRQVDGVWRVDGVTPVIDAGNSV